MYYIMETKKDDKYVMKVINACCMYLLGVGRYEKARAVVAKLIREEKIKLAKEENMINERC